jgi:hypothetical protein
MKNLQNEEAIGVYLCWIAMELEKAHGGDTTSKVTSLKEHIKRECPTLTGDMVAGLYRSVLNSQKVTRDFVGKACPELLQAWQDGFFDIRTGEAVATFSEDQQRVISAGLDNGTISIKDLKPIVDFIHRLDGDQADPEPEEFVTFSNQMAKVIYAADSYQEDGSENRQNQSI